MCHVTLEMGHFVPHFKKVVWKIKIHLRSHGNKIMSYLPPALKLKMEQSISFWLVHYLAVESRGYRSMGSLCGRTGLVHLGGCGGVFRHPQTLNTRGWLERMAAMVFRGRSWTKSPYTIRQVVNSNESKSDDLVPLCVNTEDEEPLV